MAARAAPCTFACSKCGWTASRWVGRCPQCRAWGILEEDGAPYTRTSALAPMSPTTPIIEVSTTASVKQPTGMDEFDRVLGGGLVPGAIVLLVGEPGVGEPTLLFDVAVRVAEAAAQSDRAPVLYVSGEELASQVRLRAERIGAFHGHLHLAAESDLATILGHVDPVRSSLLTADSMRITTDSQIEGVVGGVAQVHGVMSVFIADARTRPMSALPVRHVTKEGSIAGPRVFEHPVDVVCQSEGDRHSSLRAAHAVKSHYDPTEEVGCFELNEVGIHGLVDPSGLFLSSRRKNAPGICVTVALEGW